MVGVYRYEAIARPNRRERGRIEAESEADAIRALGERGLFVIGLKAMSEKSDFWNRELKLDFLQSRVKPDDFVPFCRQFATLVRAGVPLVPALQVLEEQLPKGPLKKAVGEVAAKVEGGTALWESLADYPKVFPKMFMQMVRAGEASGTLEEVLESTARFEEGQRETVSKIKSALMYPALVSVMSVLVAGFLMINVIPTFVSVFASMHVTLPLPTRIVLFAADAVKRFWYLALLVIALLVGGWIFVSRHGESRYWRDRLLLHVPIFGKLMRYQAMAQASRTLAMLFHAALPALSAMSLAADAVSNRYVRVSLRRVRESLGEGGSLSEALQRSGAFTPLMVQIVRVGETTGQLDEMLARVASFYEAELEVMVERLRQLLEPLLTTVLVGRRGRDRAVRAVADVLAVQQPRFLQRIVKSCEPVKIVASLARKHIQGHILPV